MRFWKSIISGICYTALTSCTAVPGAFAVRSATIDAGTLSTHLQWQPDADVLAALDHGIALNFVVTVQALAPGRFGPQSVAMQRRRVELRYYPLSRQYQLRDLDRGVARSYAARALVLAALDDLRLPLSDWNAHGAQRYRVNVALDRDTLPGALRLPALLRQAWRLSGEYTWPARAG
ncbi:MAG TPA: DUF4390 domain-containing protein [Rudaea sp.]